ncbi:MAG: HD domain-containing protein [Phormidesmis sp. RL_2_1]|nr:HD domain-containing protein [Phormidesmis sp. RL_2_1]
MSIAALTLRPVVDCFITRGHEQYGREAVTQLQHALQCATYAESAGESSTLVAACLLHDVGHLLHDLGEDAAERGLDDRHEYRALPFLSALFPAAVTEPIRLHVNAKRYLCATQEDYWAELSNASKLSLELQGGIFSEAEAMAFINQPHAKDAVQLRIWDDLAKDPAQKTPNFEHFLPTLVDCLVPSTRLGF